MQDDPSFISRQTLDSRYFYLNLSISEVDDPRFDVVCGGMEQTAPSYCVVRPDFPYIGVELVAEGQGELVLGSKTFELNPGSMFAYGPGVYHEIRSRSQNQMRKYFLDLVGWEARQLVKNAGLLNGEPCVVGNVVELTRVWDSIDREAKESTSVTRELCECLSRVFLLKLRQRRIKGEDRIPESYKTYQEICRYMEDNFLDLKTAKQIAAACSVTPTYLARLFKKYSSTTAYQKLMLLRMNYAADLLSENKMQVKDVAESMGFADPFQFSRAFKRVFGVPPTTLQKRRWGQ